ncbi:HAD family hydrolase [Rhodospirillum rubrum]|nr:HAD family hydrolase [Rhodospirillum rubrum]AEO49172.1 hypothetical protein F11_13550 [Rhodospirillum rubrum F11]QXG79405.1 hypothetical protein KUL73_13605 [Rhodospirillum rubrum]
MAEGKARKRGKPPAKGRETSIEDIYARFAVRPFGLTADDRPALVAAEFAAEHDLCFVNESVLALYRALQADGIKVGFLSDTYWNAERLGALLRHCVPGLTWDFLYASCDHGVGKADGLFDRYLKKQGWKPTTVAHIGDNPQADIQAPGALGIQTYHCPQCPPADVGLFQREDHIFEMICAADGASLRLDDGLRTIRRQITAMIPHPSPMARVGVSVLGPVLSGFHHFVADRLAKIAQDNPSVRVAFLARDGLAPYRLWQDSGREAAYLEINRRIALVAGTTDQESLGALFKDMSLVDEAAISAFLKHSSPKISRYFQRLPKGQSTGRAFAEALPSLLTRAETRTIGQAIRARLMAYLRAAIPDLDHCGDLVLVDLGYSGTIQKGLRTIFDQEGLSVRLHGLYLITNDEAFDELPSHDSAEGYLSSGVMSPRTSLAILRNIALIEQFCGAPEGSVRDYQNAAVVREPDPRSAEHLALCAEVREGAFAFAQHYAALSTKGWPNPLASPDLAAPHIAAVLARLLLLPSDTDLALFGGITLDVNLGTQGQVPLVDSGTTQSLLAKMPMAGTFGTTAQIMWMAASAAVISPVHGHFYALFAAGLMPGDVVGDAPCGEVTVTLVTAGGLAQLKIACQRTGFGDLRLHIPLITTNQTSPAIMLPMNEIGREGILQGLTLSTGPSIRDAMDSDTPQDLSTDALEGSDLVITGAGYQASGSAPILLIKVPPVSSPYAVLTITLTPIGAGRLLALPA